MVLHQEPLASEAISPKVARPYIQALHSINLDTNEEEQQQGEENEENELVGKVSTECDQESESQDTEESIHQEELKAVLEQVALFFIIIDCNRTVSTIVIKLKVPIFKGYYSTE